MKITKTEYSYQVTECDLKFGKQITLDGELLIPASVLKKIIEEIDDEAEYAYADFDKYKEDILHAEPDELPDDDFRYGLRRAIEIINKYKVKGDLAIKQEPFINKACVSSKVCEHDKEVVLDKIKAEIEQEYIDDGAMQEYTVDRCLEIIDKYRAESEVENDI